MTESVGRRYPLLLYRRTIKPFRRLSLLLAILLLALWLLVRDSLVSWPPSSGAPWLLAGGLVSALLWLYSVLGPRLAYAQPRSDHLRLQTPIYRLKISYRRILATRPVNLAKTFGQHGLRGSRLRLLEPFMDRTALGVDLRAYPLRPIVLRLFFHPLFLAPDRTGLILIVDDWMKLSEQLSDNLGDSRAGPEDRDRRHFSDAARILSDQD